MAKKRIGVLRESVVAEREVVEGESVPTWQSIGAAFRADVAPARASEAEKQGAIRAISAYTFTAWTKALRELGLAEDHRLVWGGRAWNIREIRWPQSGELYTDVIAEQGVTL